ncbi:hypothetical protein [Bradyrhizobium embrapense]
MPAIVMIAANEPMADRRVSIIVVVVSCERFMSPPDDLRQPTCRPNRTARDSGSFDELG